MVNVDQCVAMNSLKGGIRKAILNPLERLGCHELSFGRDDPDHVAIRLECEDLAGIQKEVLFADPPYNFFRALCG